MTTSFSKLFLLQFGSTRFIRLWIGMLFLIMVGGIMVFNPVSLRIPPDAPGFEMQLLAIQNLLAGMPFSIPLVLFVIAETVSGHQQRIFRNYLCQGFSRLLLAIYQLFNVFTLLIGLLILVQLVVFGLGSLNMGFNILRFFNGHYFTNLAGIVLLLILPGFMALFLAGIIRSSFAFFAYLTWWLAEKILINYDNTQWKTGLFEYLPMNLNTCVFEQNPPDNNWVISGIVLAVWVSMFVAGHVYWMLKKNW